MEVKIIFEKLDVNRDQANSNSFQRMILLQLAPSELAVEIRPWPSRWSPSFSHAIAAQANVVEEAAELPL